MRSAVRHGNHGGMASSRKDTSMWWRDCGLASFIIRPCLGVYLFDTLPKWVSITPS
jgi:hypothetical protein